MTEKEKITKLMPNFFGFVQCLNPQCPYGNYTESETAQLCPRKTMDRHCAGYGK